MLEEIIIAGFGGQGVLSMGMTLAYAGMIEEKEISWMPSYGPEMRGGTANCTVVIADHEIGSPLVKNPPLVIALNLPSYDKYEPVMQAGGTLVVNQSMVDRGAKRTDINTVFVPANEIAEQIGDKKLTNMVTVGALLAALPEVTLETIQAALKAHLPARHQHLLPKNYEALRRGFESAKEQLAVAV
jgi:2-oxoglutarate ferredoxin oxidoreductase subunit gamma